MRALHSRSLRCTRQNHLCTSALKTAFCEIAYGPARVSLGTLCDSRTGAHQIYHLVAECAYEHWHRMLFARFLAENGKLMANSEALSTQNTPVTLEECEELAADEGAANGWELAGRYASRMLPQIFRPDAPVLAVHLPPERQRRLEQILADLEPATFKARDALGWVYQFWQAKKNAEVNASGVEIGADELPSVTQRFTEPYMVDFIVHNTVGAWWAHRVLQERPDLARGAVGEDKLREACRLSAHGWETLRFVRDGEYWRPAFDGVADWPESLDEFRVLDPCCGSGHFLIAMFVALVAVRGEAESMTAQQAVTHVLQDNIAGLDIDPRVTEIAAFALALTAWTLPGTEYGAPSPDQDCVFRYRAQSKQGRVALPLRRRRRRVSKRDVDALSHVSGCANAW